MSITIMEKQYDVQVQYHQLRNITYVLLDAPVFRQQTKTEPYPPRMDDLDSAICAYIDITLYLTEYRC